jgi:hypothetical protein
MRDTVLRKMKNARNDFENKERQIWVMDEQHPGQAISTIAHLFWCSGTEFYIYSMTDNPDSLAEW